MTTGDVQRSDHEIDCRPEVERGPPRNIKRNRQAWQGRTAEEKPPTGEFSFSWPLSLENPESPDTIMSEEALAAHKQPVRWLHFTVAMIE
jgi:hypothetical protein